MTPRPPRPLLARTLGLLTLACGLGALGCSKSPFGWTIAFVPQPVTDERTIGAGTTGRLGQLPTPTPAPSTGATAPTASATPTSAPTGGSGPTATPGSVAPSATPSVSLTLPPDDSAVFAPVDPDAPLPSPSTFSDLEPAEQASVEAALESEALADFLPSDLIHDGGVVIYRLAALTSPKPTYFPSPGIVMTAPPLPNGQPTFGPGALPRGTPPPYKRELSAGSSQQLTLAKDCAEGEACKPGQRPIVATVRYHRKGTFIAKTFDGTELRKPFGQLIRRRLVLRPSATNKLEVVAATPLHLESSGGAGGPVVRQVAFFPAGADKPSGELLDLEAPKPVDRRPRLVAGTRAIVEIWVEARGSQLPYVQVRRDGDDLARRIDAVERPLSLDDPGLKVFRAEFTVPDKPGQAEFQQLVIDLLDPISFAKEGTPYRARTLILDYGVDFKEG